MEISFLGTSAGKPTKTRSLSAITLRVEQDKKWYLFDCGEGTQFQLLHSNLSINKLEAIFITHLHGDHFYGLPGLLSSKMMDNALNPITLYGPKGIKEFIDITLKVSNSKLSFKLNIVEYNLYEEFEFDKFKIKILPLIHSIDSVAFYLEEHDKTDRLNETKLRKIGLNPSPLYGKLKRGEKIIHNGKEIKPQDYMLEDIKGKKIIIAGDNRQPDILSNYLSKLDLLIHECTYTQSVYNNLEKKFLHTTAKDLAKTCQNFDVKNLIATHISPRYNTKGKHSIELIKQEIKRYYNKTFYIAEDFDKFFLSKSKLIRLR